MTLPDPRIITGIAYLIVGLSAIGVSLRIWWTPSINRVFSLGPFVTEEGLRFVLQHTRMVFALGAFAVASGLSRFAYWQAGVAHSSTGWHHFFGVVETIFAAWAAGCVIYAAWRACGKK
jgi:hypothetical protein